MLYFFVSVYGMAMFAQRMWKLTELSSSASQRRLDVNGNVMIFNQSQQKLLYTTTKYVTLLSIAMVTTWIFTACSLYFEVDKILIINGTNIDIAGYLSNFMGSLDMLINIICLYLQYPFNKVRYDKYCICFTNFCTNLLTKREVQRYRMSIELHKGNHRQINSIEPATPTLQSPDSNSSPRYQYDGAIKTEEIEEIKINEIKINRNDDINKSQLSMTTINAQDEELLHETMDEVLRE